MSYSSESEHIEVIRSLIQHCEVVRIGDSGKVYTTPPLMKVANEEGMNEEYEEFLDSDYADMKLWKSFHYINAARDFGVTVRRAD